jgi:hypothetical protein
VLAIIGRVELEAGAASLRQPAGDVVEDRRADPAAPMRVRDDHVADEPERRVCDAGTDTRQPSIGIGHDDAARVRLTDHGVQRPLVLGPSDGSAHRGDGGKVASIRLSLAQVLRKAHAVRSLSKPIRASGRTP